MVRHYVIAPLDSTKAGKNQTEMSQRQLTQVMVLLVVAMAAGFLFLLFRSSTRVAVDKRLTDVAAERAAGTLRGEAVGSGGGVVVESAVEVDIAGEFKSFGGEAGPDVGSWPRFRGVDFSNRAEGPPLLEDWPAGGPRSIWRTKVGQGYAGPAVHRGRVFLLDYDEEAGGDALRVFSLADGAEIWRRTYRAPIKKNHGFSRTVPAVDDDYILTLGPRCIAMCVRMETGDFIWGKDLVAEYGTEVPLWYTGQCPLMDGGVAVLAPGGSALLVGVDCATGEVVWETPNPDAWGMSHSSVVPATLLGRRMYVYCAKEGVVGVAADGVERGKVLWRTTAWAHPVTSPSALPIDDHRVFVPAGYVEMVRRILSGRLEDTALWAEVLTLPSESYLGDQMDEVDVDGIHRCRETVRARIGQALEGELVALVRRLEEAGPYQAEPGDIGRRALKNLALGYLMAGGGRMARELCLEQYRAGHNMTDVMAALRLLADSDDPERDAVLTDFESRWGNDPLVMDKWFSVQALSGRPDTLPRVRALMRHPAFSIRNPNKVRALIGAFTANQVCFHAADGAGYRFLLDRVLELDPLNPQIASRMLRQLARWRRYDSARRALMQAQLQRIMDAPKVSKDVYEIASRSLEESH